MNSVAAASFVSAELRGRVNADLIASLLAVAAVEQVEPRAISAEQFRLLQSHRVLSLVPGSWQDRVDGDLANAHRRIAMTQLRLYSALEMMLERFAAAGIESRVLKGLATSRLDYERPSQRHTGDIDVLVDRSSLPAAIEIVRSEGGTGRGLATAGSDLSKGVTLTLPSGVQVDLHTRLNRFSERSKRTLFADAVLIPGSTGFAFPAELRLVHAAAHLLYTPPGHRRISGLADITAILTHQNVDNDKARRIAADLGIERVAGAALRIEAELRGHPNRVGVGWAEPTRLERLSFVRSERQLAMEHVLALRTVKTFAGRAEYLRTWALPSGEHRDIRGGVSGYFKRALPRRLGGQNLRNSR